MPGSPPHPDPLPRSGRGGVTARRFAASRRRQIAAQLGIVIGVERAHYAVPPRKMRRVVAPEIAVVLVVMRDADQRGRGTAPDAAVLPARMPDHAGDLVVDLVREQHRGRRRHQEMRDQPIGLQEQIVDETVAVVRPDHRGDRHMVPAVHAAIQAPRMDQPVKPVEPRIEHDERQHERKPRPGNPVERPNPPAELGIEPMPGAEHRGDRGKRDEALGAVAADLRRRCRAALDLGRGDPAVQPAHDEAAQQVGRGQDRVDRGDGQRPRDQPLCHRQNRPPGAARKRAPVVTLANRWRFSIAGAGCAVRRFLYGVAGGPTRAGMTQIAFGSSMRRTMLSLM